MTGRAATGAPLGDDTDLTAGGAAAGEGTPTVSLAALAAGPAEAIEPDPVLLQAIEVWRVRLSSAGVACRAVAVHGADPQWRVSFPAALTAVQNQWSELCSRPDPLPPGAVVRIDLQAGMLDDLKIGGIDTRHRLIVSHCVSRTTAVCVLLRWRGAGDRQNDWSGGGLAGFEFFDLRHLSRPTARRSLIRHAARE